MNNHSNWETAFTPSSFLKDKPVIGYLSPFLATMSFPRKEPPAGEKILRYDGHKTLIIQPGYRISGDEANPIPAPHGIFPRLIITYVINTVRERWINGHTEEECRLISFGKTRYEFLKRIGYIDSGKSYRALAIQLERLLSARFIISLPQEPLADIQYDVARRQYNFTLGDEHDLWIPHRLEDQSLWDATLKVSASMYESITSSASPIYLNALREWSHLTRNTVTNCWIMDIGTWLSYRMHNVKKHTRISVDQLRAQFGPGQRDDWRYMQTIQNALDHIYPHWPELVNHVEINKLGITLFPGTTMVPRNAFDNQLNN